MQNDVNA